MQLVFRSFSALFFPFVSFFDLFLFSFFSSLFLGFMLSACPSYPISCVVVCEMSSPRSQNTQNDLGSKKFIKHRQL